HVVVELLLPLVLVALGETGDVALVEDCARAESFKDLPNLRGLHGDVSRVFRPADATEDGQQCACQLHGKATRGEETENESNHVELRGISVWGSIGARDEVRLTALWNLQGTGHEPRINPP